MCFIGSTGAERKKIVTVTVKKRHFAPFGHPCRFAAPVLDVERRHVQIQWVFSLLDALRQHDAQVEVAYDGYIAGQLPHADQFRPGKAAIVDQDPFRAETAQAQIDLGVQVGCHADAQ